MESLIDYKESSTSSFFLTFRYLCTCDSKEKRKKSLHFIYFVFIFFSLLPQFPSALYHFFELFRLKSKCNLHNWKVNRIYNRVGHFEKCKQNSNRFATRRYYFTSIADSNSKWHHKIFMQKSIDVSALTFRIWFHVFSIYFEWIAFRICFNCIPFNCSVHIFHFAFRFG